MATKRGSEKLMTAWKQRSLTDEAVREIAAELEKSPATIEKVNVVGGQDATGMQVLLSYSGDDVPWCGNDLAFWLKWRRRFGGTVRPPRILINGTPFPDLVRVQLDFGNVGGETVGIDLQDELNVDVELGR